MLSCLGYCHTVLATVGWRASWVKVRASIVVGEERAESPVAEREKERMSNGRLAKRRAEAGEL